MIIPNDSVSKEALTAIIEDWLSRQTQETDVTDASLADRVATVEQNLKQKLLFLTWDDESQTVNLVSRDTLRDAGLLE